LSEALVLSVTSIVPVSEIESPRLPPVGLKLSASAHARLFSVTGAQLAMFTGIGAMKSLISDVKASDERLFRYAFPNTVH